MNFHREMPFSGEVARHSGYLDEFVTDGRSLKAAGEGFEWMSASAEDCFTENSPENVAPHAGKPAEEIAATARPQKLSKARNKRKRPMLAVPPAVDVEARIAEEEEEEDLESYDPPLLDQMYWLADSELIILQKNPKEEEKDEERIIDRERKEVVGGDARQQRRCTHCLAQRTPQWRVGPLGPRTLCNACGVRFKSGRLFPEYRPAKSPTFVNCKHSNSHKKVMEMRVMSSMSVDASNPLNH